MNSASEKRRTSLRASIYHNRSTRKEKKEAEKIFEKITTVTFPNLLKIFNIHI